MLGLKKKKKSEEQETLALTPLQLVAKSPALWESEQAPSPKKAKDSSELNEDSELTRLNNLSRSMHAKISARAYEFHEERCRIGAPLQDWLRAEREVLALLEYED